MSFEKLLRMIIVMLVLAVVAVGTSVQPAAAQGPTFNHTNVPDADARSGRFVNITRGLSSLGEVGTNFAIQTSVDQPDLEIRIFDGDTGGTWDPYSPPSATCD